MRHLLPNPDRVLAATPDFRIGTFRCPLQQPDFSTAGPIEGYSVVFPRSAVWIQHQGGRAFVADPGVVTIYNRGQAYRRLPLGPEGDRSDWLSASRELANSIMYGIDPNGGADSDRPFPVAYGPSSAALYYRQRVLFGRVQRGAIDRFELEQEVVLLIGAALARAVGAAGKPVRRSGERDLVEAARAVIARDPLRQWTIRQLAAQLEASPFHLCRVFRRITGLTLHHYQLELRTRLALEHLTAPANSLSRLAAELGFSSHSHFSSAFRARMGRTPSGARAQLSLH